MTSANRKFVLSSILALILITAVIIFWREWSLWSPPLAKSKDEARILNVLEDMSQSGTTDAGVPIEDGRALRLLAESINAKNVVEIGTSTGYSGLWLCLALHSTGGRLTTFEIDPGRAAIARKQFVTAGVDNIATVIEGNAHQKISSLQDPIDLVFLDADKEGYVDYLEKLLPLVRPGGLILAHNARMAAFFSEYIKEISKNQELETIYYEAGRGLAITMKKR